MSMSPYELNLLLYTYYSGKRYSRAFDVEAPMFRETIAKLVNADMMIAEEEAPVGYRLTRRGLETIDKALFSATIEPQSAEIARLPEDRIASQSYPPSPSPALSGPIEEQPRRLHLRQGHAASDRSAVHSRPNPEPQPMPYHKPEHAPALTADSAKVDPRHDTVTLLVEDLDPQNTLPALPKISFEVADMKYLEIEVRCLPKQRLCGIQTSGQRPAQTDPAHSES